jgi:hypothetical protein
LCGCLIAGGCAVTLLNVVTPKVIDSRSVTGVWRSWLSYSQKLSVLQIPLFLFLWSGARVGRLEFDVPEDEADRAWVRDTSTVFRKLSPIEIFRKLSPIENGSRQRLYAIGEGWLKHILSLTRMALLPIRRLFVSSFWKAVVPAMGDVRN